MSDTRIALHLYLPRRALGDFRYLPSVRRSQIFSLSPRSPSSCPKPRDFRPAPLSAYAHPTHSPSTDCGYAAIRSTQSSGLEMRPSGTYLLRPYNSAVF
eukprot:2266677-Rhodomonas_salina.11